MSQATTAPRVRTAYPPGVKAWRNGIFVVFAGLGVAAASLAARIPSISIALGLNAAQVGVLLAGIAIGSIAGLLASSHVISHFGVRKTLSVAFTIAAAAAALASIGISVFGSFALSFGALILFGITFATCDVSINIAGAANERASGRSLMPIFHGFFSIGTILGAALGTLAEALSIPLHIHITVVAVIIATATLVALRWFMPEAPLDENGDAHPGSTWRARLSIWREPKTILIGLLVLGMAFTEGSSNDWLSYAMVHGHGSDRATGAAVYGVFVAAMTVGRLSGVRFIDRFGRVPVLWTTAIFAAVGLLLFIFVPVFWVVLVGVVLWGLGASLGFPLGMSAAADDPRTAAARVSAVATIGYLAFLVGPPVIGFLGNQFGILNALLLVLVLAALAGAVSFAAREPAGAR